MTLKKVQAKLHIVTDPPGAAVFIDDEAYPGTTPIEVAVESGRHNIVIVKDGFRDVVRRGIDLSREAAPFGAGPPGSEGAEGGDVGSIRSTRAPEFNVRLTPGPSTYDPFRRLYSDPTQPQRMKLFFGADDRFVLHHNGRQIGRGNDWIRLFEFDVELRNGDVIAAEVTDVSGGAEGKCGF